MREDDKLFIAAMAFIAAFLIAIGFAFYMKYQITGRFCDKYFPEAPTFDCVMSSRYRYDGDK